MRTLHLVACAGLVLLGCSVADSVPRPDPDRAESPPEAEPPPSNGVRAFVALPDKARSDDLNDRLHFCVFERGGDDWIYVGVNYGLWSAGTFDLSVGQRVAFTGHVDYLLYGGTILRMGDAVQKQHAHSELRITRVEGMLK